MKKLIFDTPKGQYSIPLELVARDRADYYSVIVDGNKIDSEEYKAEVEYTMDDNFEAIDWILNNSDWEDWKDKATKINDKVNVTDDNFWTSSDNFEIKEVNE
jgi:enolase